MQPLRQALFLAFLALSLLQVDAYVAQTRSGTNAARLAHGQPLVRPKRLFHPGLNVARDLAPSGTPTTPGTSSSVVTPSSDPSSSATSDSATPTSASSSAVSSSDSATPTSASASSSVSPPPSSSASPSSSSSAPTPTAPAPGTVLTGRVGIYTTNTGTTTPVKRDDATFVGYLGAYGVTTESDGSLASGPWVYTYTVPASSSQPVNLDHSGTPYRLSAVAIRSGPQVTLGPGNSVYLEAENTRANTPAGSATSTYVYDTYAIGYAQTAVWILDSATGLVTCQWVNPDGSRPRVYSVKSGSGLYLTGDIAALRSQLGNPSDFTQVDLYHLTTSH